MSKRKLGLLLLVFLIYEALVWVGSVWLSDSYLLIGFVLDRKSVV